MSPQTYGDPLESLDPYVGNHWSKLPTVYKVVKPSSTSSSYNSKMLLTR